MIRAIALSLLVAAPLAAPAAAQSNAVRLASVDALEAQAQLNSRDGGAQIELAQAYLRADRPADAERAYRRALTLDNEMMETRNGSAIWSHQVAKLMLARNVAVAGR